MTSVITKIIGQQNTKDTNGTPPAQIHPPATDVADANYKKFRMSEGDLNRTLQLCGLNSGQEDQLPEWFSQIVERNLSTNGKRSIIKILFNGNFP